MADEPENLVLHLLRDMREQMAGMATNLDKKIDDLGADLRSEMRSLRADVASDLLTMDAKNEAAHRQTREQIVGLRRAVVEYHSSAVGHGVLFSEIEERLRVVERKLNIETH